ncbi:MAG TPA: hypothetical protein VKA70_08425 [Blastocatellia bacterium]|nr:hypothetical protein [Blastocatellia bacterium]
MAEMIQRYAEKIEGPSGASYDVFVYGEQRPDGKWEGWLEFHSADARVLRTARETTQPNREALAYWASGLEPLYFEGAFARAREVR